MGKTMRFLLMEPSMKSFLIQMIETIFVLGNWYDWKEGKVKLYYQNFGRALKGQPSKKWEGFDNFRSKIIELGS
jgi:hypothetical protein